MRAAMTSRVSSPDGKTATRPRCRSSFRSSTRSCDGWRGDKWRASPGHTLQPTALVNEAYLRLVNLKQMQWQDRAHFFAMAARLMRRILVDFARSRGYQKRGGGAQQVSFTRALDVAEARPTDVVALDDALEALAHVDERKSRVVELRFYGGLSVEETAEVLNVSRETVKRDWTFAKMWLLRHLRK